MSESSLENIKQYITEKKPLSYEAQLWIFRKDPSRRTVADEELLIDSNLAMVFKVASDSYKRHQQISNDFTNAPEVKFCDLFQAGIVGLHKSVEKFDSKLSMKFSTYAYYWINALIRNEIRSCIYPMRTQSYAQVSFKYTDATNEKDSEQLDENFYDRIYFNDIISEAKRLLNSLDFTIFKLFFVEGIPVKEVATSVDRCEVTVRSHIKSIRKILCKRLV